jgi:hypothetical protein
MCSTTTTTTTKLRPATRREETMHGDEVRATPTQRHCSTTLTAHPVRPQRGKHLRHQQRSNYQPKNNLRQPTWTCQERRM